jgi:hypothetical protein
MKIFILFVVFSLITFSQTVYVTKSGTKHHTEECKYAKNGKAIDLKDVSPSFAPCTLCNASKLTKNSELGQTSTTKEKIIQKEKTGGGRCQGTTKKGAQCKRNAKAGSKYCWQHE